MPFQKIEPSACCDWQAVTLSIWFCFDVFGRRFASRYVFCANLNESELRVGIVSVFVTPELKVACPQVF